MAKIGSKDWFSEKWNDSDSKEMKGYDPSSKDQELKFSHTIYAHVKSNCPFGILHKKEERLKIKDELIELFYKSSALSSKYFIENKQDFPDESWGDSLNVNNMFFKSEANKWFPKESKQHIEAMFFILNNLISADIIKRTKSNKEKNEDLLKEILKDEYSVIPAISELMSAHLYLQQHFPEDWLDSMQLDPNSSTNPIFDGRFYQPDTFHCWIVNLSWMMAHLHKGNNFIIFSAVSDENLIRKTKGHEGELSGFAREITMAKKIGYHIEIKNDTIFMNATEEVKSRCQNLCFEDVYMTNEEIERIYSEIKIEIDSASKKNKDTEEKSETKKRERLEESSTYGFYSHSVEDKKKRKIEREEEKMNVNSTTNIQT
jgi:hypothetical protein